MTMAAAGLAISCTDKKDDNNDYNQFVRTYSVAIEGTGTIPPGITMKVVDTIVGLEVAKAGDNFTAQTSFSISGQAVSVDLTLSEVKWVNSKTARFKIAPQTITLTAAAGSSRKDTIQGVPDPQKEDFHGELAYAADGTPSIVLSVTGNVMSMPVTISVKTDVRNQFVGTYEVDLTAEVMNDTIRDTVDLVVRRGGGADTFIVTTGFTIQSIFVVINNLVLDTLTWNPFNYKQVGFRIGEQAVVELNNANAGSVKGVVYPNDQQLNPVSAHGGFSYDGNVPAIAFGANASISLFPDGNPLPVKITIAGKKKQ